MITFNNIVSELQPIRQSLAEKYHIGTLAVFGSVSRGDNTDASDIDMLVDFSQPIGIAFVDLADELESILKHPVDLVSRNGIKAGYFEAIKKELKYV
jgi:predicted nucleotidyltransferase